MSVSQKVFASDLFTAVYADGNVCISILHSPGDDPNMYESSSERWSPVQNVNSILLSVLSMLAGKGIFVLFSDLMTSLNRVPQSRISNQVQMSMFA